VYYGTISFDEVHMKSKYVLAALVSALLAGLVPAPAWAQLAGLRVAVGQPQPAFPPTQAPATAVRSTFAAPAYWPVTPPPFSPFAQPPLTPRIPLVPNFPTVIVPNTILIPGQQVYPGYPTVVTGPPVVVNGPNPIQPGLPFAPGARRLPPIGTPRADVLRFYGQPSVTVITSSGETLYFTGGVTVLIQNGQVIGPR
jgi:hypothetical protein